MGHPLDGCHLKLDRAEAHRMELARELARYFGRDPYSVPRETDVKRKKQVFHFILRLKEDLPVQLGVIIGDCAHNLRCALDYLAYELVRLEQGKPKGLTYFPIYTDVNAYREFRQTDEARIRYMNLRHRAILNRLQPYHRGNQADSHPLAILKRINNRDKHRVLHTTFANLEQEGHALKVTSQKDVARILSVTPHYGRMKDGAELLTVHLIPSGPDPVVNVEGNAEIAIALNNGLPIVPVLKEVRDFVVATVRLFEPFFP